MNLAPRSWAQALLVELCPPGALFPAVTARPDTRPLLRARTLRYSCTRARKPLLSGQSTRTTLSPATKAPSSSSASVPEPSSPFAPPPASASRMPRPTVYPNKPAPGSKPMEPSPSASIILISPTNTILLLHRIQRASSFPSAHVFPGGNLTSSDGAIPLPGSPERHKDSPAYRVGAIRELFEESGILLAKKKKSKNDGGKLIEVSAQDRLRGRKAIHSKKIRFSKWLEEQDPDAELDTDSLIPFTHWVTPANVPKRYTTQMYVYFIDPAEQGNESIEAASDEVEVTAAEWQPAHKWIAKAQTGEVILFPPQFLLLSLISDHLDIPQDEGQIEPWEISSRRKSLRHFIDNDGTPPWRHKYISPTGLGLPTPREDGRTVMSLDKPGPELRGSGLEGEKERVILVKFRKEGPRQLEVALRKDVLGDARRDEEKGGPSKL